MSTIVDRVARRFVATTEPFDWRKVEAWQKEIEKFRPRARRLQQKHFDNEEKGLPEDRGLIVKAQQIGKIVTEASKQAYDYLAPYVASLNDPKINEAWDYFKDWIAEWDELMADPVKHSTTARHRFGLHGETVGSVLAHFWADPDRHVDALRRLNGMISRALR